MKKDTEIKLIDIHTHILPGVDDGAIDLEEALALCRLAWENGTRAIFLTPHYRGIYKKEPAILQAAYGVLHKAIAKELPKMTLHLGCEIRYQADMDDKIRENALLPMANSRYILLEFPSTAFPTQILSGILECTGAGKLPIIAHAERYDAFRHDPTLTEEALKLGARIQLNADSIMGKHGFFVKRFCHKLLKEEKVHFIASDAHDLRRRPPVLLPCYKRICKKYGEKYAKRIFWKNPRAILENKTL